MKKIIILICCFIGISITVYPQNVNGRFTSSVYSFQRYDNVNSVGDYFRTFQMLNLNVNMNNVSLRTYVNFEGDMFQDLKFDPMLRFYNLYLEVRDILNVATVKLGRQPLFNSVAGGLFDGLTLDLKKDDYKFSAYYGSDVPAYQKLEVRKLSEWGDNFILGGKFTTIALKDFQVSLSYINKNFKPQPYWATRLNTELNPIQVLIQNNSSQYQFASAEVNYDYKSKVNVNTRYDYDLNFNQTSKFELDGSYLPIQKLSLDFYYNYRAPLINYNSIFSVFDYGNTQEVEVGAGYELNKIFTLTGRYGNVIYKDDNSQRVTIGLNSNYGTLSYRKTFGYEGELDALSLYTAYTLLKGLITPSLGISYSNYKLSQDDPRNNLTTILAGINYRPARMISFDLQGQYMNNVIYRNDFRVFFKLNYWFNSKL